MADNNNNRTTTTTQIRNLYSEGMSYLNTKFFNTNLCFTFYPFISKDNTGRSTYDMKNGVATTVNYEGAYALYHVAKNIINGELNECDLPIPCAAGATLNLRRQMSQLGTMETVFSITKNNVTIPFKFQTITMNVKENGQPTVKIIESGLGSFMKIVDGYLNGINADRHLDKLTDEYVKALQDNQTQQQSGQQPQQNWNSNKAPTNNGGNNYRGGNYNNGGNNNYKKPYNNNGYNKPRQYNNNNGWQPPQQQNLNSYEIKN